MKIKVLSPCTPPYISRVLLRCLVPYTKPPELSVLWHDTMFPFCIFEQGIIGSYVSIEISRYYVVAIELY